MRSAHHDSPRHNTDKLGSTAPDVAAGPGDAGNAHAEDARAGEAGMGYASAGGAGAGDAGAENARQPAPIDSGRGEAQRADAERAGPRPAARRRFRQLAGAAAAALYELLMLLPLLRILDVLAVPAGLDRLWLYLVPALSAGGALAGGWLQPMWQRLALALATGTVCLLADDGEWTAAGTFALTAVAVLLGATASSRARHIQWYFSGVILHAAASVLFAVSPALRPLQDAGWLASLAVLAVAVFTLNHRHLLWAAVAGERPKTVPASIRRHNRLYVAGLLIVAVMLAGGLGGFLGQLVRDALRTAIRWLSGRGGAPEPPPLTGEPPPEMPPDWLPPPRKPPAWLRILDLLAWALGWVALAAALIGLAFLLYRHGGPTLRKWLNALLAFLNRRPDAPKSDAGYVDEETGLFSWKETRQRWRDSRISRLLRGKRGERWEDLPDNRARVRFLYRRWLHRLSEAGYRPQRHLTPRETATDAAAWIAAPAGRTPATAKRAAKTPIGPDRHPPASMPGKRGMAASGFTAETGSRLLIDLYYESRYAEREPTEEEMGTLLQGLDPGLAPPKR